MVVADAGFKLTEMKRTW